MNTLRIAFVGLGALGALRLFGRSRQTSDDGHDHSPEREGGGCCGGHSHEDVAKGRHRCGEHEVEPAEPGTAEAEGEETLAGRGPPAHRAA